MAEEIKYFKNYEEKIQGKFITIGGRNKIDGKIK